MYKTDVVDKIQTHISCSVTFFSDNRAVYEIMNFIQPAWPQTTIWLTHIACWIPKATNSHSEYVTLSAFPLQHWLHEHATVLLYTYVTLGF
jgi:hypothetical protein